MESQPQNPEFRIHPENFHPCIIKLKINRFKFSATKLELA